MSTTFDFSTFKYKEVIQDINKWKVLKGKEAKQIVHEIAFMVKERLTLNEVCNYGINEKVYIPSFIEDNSGLLFHFIPGGKFTFGLSEREETLLKMSGIDFDLSLMKPAKDIWVKPFFITRFPIIANFVNEHITTDPDLFRPVFGNEEEDSVCPMYLTLEEIHQLFGKFGFKIPGEVQLEYALRGGGNTLFYLGDELPQDRAVIGNSLCCNEFSDGEINNRYANLFGLVGVSIGEWCCDKWYPSHANMYDDSPYTDSSTSEYVIKGGAAAFWPWQNPEEWILAISAMRSSSEGLEDTTCGVRALLDISI
ncbi:formylglycine-generating enzyme family protein [Xanthocytophaga flava]|uniref:formylglycine-generating enzyme family protein n=1 Tax=Xanthocytophaga flava TaxID=3048013 RepID=UPI0028D60744|nr:hypothetical protein [Xanthocytophaga flavus]MDJ1469578.1 hypothetical protein [Xanthocytophaga flavus]